VTITLLGADPACAEVGAAITSSSPAVAARCIHVLPGVGVATTQNITDPRLGPSLLSALAAGEAVDDAIRLVVGAAEHVAYRQLALTDAHGNSAAWSGSCCLGVHGEVRGDRCVAAGNLLDSEAVLKAATDAFAAACGPLAARLLTGLSAAVAAGGEAGPVRSAGLLVGGPVSWPIVDLRVDDADDPLAELRRLWSVYEPLQDDYVARALDPASAPAFGVPGENTEEQASK
jgi:uncharacterized Ntn-hydrolase superfamily protein